VAVATTALSRPILVVLAAMCLYIALILCAANRLNLWHVDMLKDTMIWAFGPALVMVFNHDNASRNPDHFKKTVLAAIRLTVLIEFVINFYVLHIALELVMFPAMLVLASLLAVAESKQEYAAVKRLTQFLLGALGTAVLSYAAIRFAGDVDSFASQDTLRLFLLPIALTVMFVPFVYALAVYTGYENIFIRLTIWVKDQELAGYLRRQIFQTCLFRLARVNKFRSEYLPALSTIRSKPDVVRLIRDFRGS